VQATTTRAVRSFGTDPSVADGLNRRPDGVLNAVDPAQQGTLEALTATLPGLTRVDGGVAAFGMGASGTGVTVNGMQQSLAALPRELAVTTTVLTSPWDATRGGFSGALVSHSIPSGGSIHRRRGRAALQGRWTDVPIGGLAPNERLARSTAISLGASGPWLGERTFYNYGLQVNQSRYRTIPLATLSPPDLDRLAQSALSLQQASDVLAERAVPAAELTVGGRTGTQFLFVERLDRRARPARDSRPPRELSLVFGGSHNTGEGLTASATSTETTGLTLRATNAFAQLASAFNTGPQARVAHQTTFNVASERMQLSPAFEFPAGRLQTTATLSDSRGAIGALRFGSSATAPERSGSHTMDLVHQTAWLVGGRAAFPSKLVAQVRVEEGWRDASPASSGLFEYASIDDFRQRRPFQFSQTNGITAARSQLVTSALASSTAWETRRLSLTGGARLDFARERRARAEAVNVADAAPLRVAAVSPRVGFTFYPKAQRGPALFSNAVNTSYRTGPHVRGGVGVFRAEPRVAELVRQSAGTGRGSEVTGIRCLGESVPADPWGTAVAATVLRGCEASASGRTEAWTSQPLLARGFQPSAATRANLGWTNTVVGHYVAFDVTASWNRYLADVTDPRYVDQARFLLAGEGGRPVFVDVGAIDPASGRSVRPATGAVSTRLTDARLRGRVLATSVFWIPRLPPQWGQWSAAYVNTQAQRQYRGFNGATDRSAREIEWASDAATPQHALVIQSAKVIRRGDVGLSFSARVNSGERFSPLVLGDVNGDGLVGDRAFLPRLGASGNAAVDAGLAALARTGALGIRGCLNEVSGAVPRRNRCTGPWTVTSNLALVIARWPGLSSRAQVSLNVSNPLSVVLPSTGGARLVSGARPIVDQTLLRVEAFRPTDPRYVYTVNENFGRVLSGVGSREPMRLVVDVRVDLAPSADLQRLKQNLRAARRPTGAINVDSVFVQYRENVFAGLYSSLVRLGDSLALSRAQVEAFQTRDGVLRARVDSIYTVLARRLATLPNLPDLRQATKDAMSADDAAWNAVYAEAGPLREVLSSGQIRRLPAAARSMLTVPGFRGRFFF